MPLDNPTTRPHTRTRPAVPHFTLAMGMAMMTKWLYKSKLVTAVLFAVAVLTFATNFPKAFGLTVVGITVAAVVWLFLWALEDRP